MHQTYVLIVPEASGGHILRVRKWYRLGLWKEVFLNNLFLINFLSYETLPTLYSLLLPPSADQLHGMSLRGRFQQLHQTYVLIVPEASGGHSLRYRKWDRLGLWKEVFLNYLFLINFSSYEPAAIVLASAHAVRRSTLRDVVAREISTIASDICADRARSVRGDTVCAIGSGTGWAYGRRSF